MKWSTEDTSDNGLACYLLSSFRYEKRTPAEVTAANANDILCRMNAGTSRIYVSTGRNGQGFSDTYRRACERIATDPKTPKYAAIDIIMWLTLTDPYILALKPGTLITQLLDGDNTQIKNCWKCLTIIGMSYAMHGSLGDALIILQNAVKLVSHDTGSVPAWLMSRVDLVAADLSKANR